MENPYITASELAEREGVLIAAVYQWVKIGGVISPPPKHIYGVLMFDPACVVKRPATGPKRKYITQSIKALSLHKLGGLDLTAEEAMVTQEYIAGSTLRQIGDGRTGRILGRQNVHVILKRVLKKAEGVF